jgi:hypothetical protein
VSLLQKEKPKPRTRTLNLRHLLRLSLLLAATAGFAQDSAQPERKLDLLPNDAWWGGAVTLGTKMPYGVAPIDINLDGDNRGNQNAPLLVSSLPRCFNASSGPRSSPRSTARRMISWAASQPIASKAHALTILRLANSTSRANCSIKS